MSINHSHKIHEGQTINKKEKNSITTLKKKNTDINVTVPVSNSNPTDNKMMRIIF